MGAKKLRGEMTPQEREAARRKAKYTQYLAESGRPTRIPAAPAVEHLAALAARGMDARDMASQSGLSVTTCRDLIRGRRPDKNGVQGKPLRDIYRETVERALTVTFAEPVTSDIVSGPRTNGVGTARRMQALMARGFSLSVTADLLGVSEQWAWQLAIHRFPMTLTRTAKAVADMYEKFQHVDPVDYGLSKFAISRAKSAASKRGYAPPECWDEDTIDDPQAVPEYTGMCGTEAGWLTHRVREVPVCEPCAAAVRRPGRAAHLGEVQGRYDYSPVAMAEAMARRGLSANALEMEMGLTKGLVSRWLRDGEHNPSWKSGLRLCDHLDLPWTDIYKRREAA